jgi:glycosyltransferase involved in cell wall biosynthesis
MEPLVSTIIPCFNREAFVGEAIESALAQDWPHKEVIVVDDGSTDGSAGVCRKFGSLIVFVQQENRGVSAARNLGLQLAQGDMFAFLDSDDLWLPGKISAQMEQMLRDEAIAVSATHLRFDPPVHIRSRYATTDTPWQELFRRDILWATPTIVTRKCLIQRIGQFREDLSHYEDRHFWLRLLLHGKYGCVDKELTVVRRVEGPNLSSQSSGHSDWIYSSLDLLELAKEHVAEEVSRNCLSYIYGQLPEMVYDSFWHGQTAKAIDLAFLQFLHGPQRVSGLKYLIASLIPGLSQFVRRNSYAGS